MKKGFSLIEMLCVIVLLSVLTSYTAGSVVKLSRHTKEKLYCTKLDLLAMASKEYGLKYEQELQNSKIYYENKQSLNITVNDLITTGFLNPDDDNSVLNPLNNTSMNNLPITIYLENGNIKTHIANNICAN